MIPDWLSIYRITGTWEEHRARGSAGGIDWGTPAGTPIYAPSDGEIDFRFFGDGSSVLRIKRADGTATEFLHGTMSGSPRAVVKDELIGYSDGRPGTTGSGPSDGEHLHVHDVTAEGVRVPPFTTITQLASNSVSNFIEQEDDDMNPRVIKKTATEGAEEWMLVAPWITGPTAKQRGYRVTTEQAVGFAWARLYAPQGAPHATLDRADYIAVQDEARKLYGVFNASLKKLFG